MSTATVAARAVPLKVTALAIALAAFLSACSDGSSSRPDSTERPRDASSSPTTAVSGLRFLTTEPGVEAACKRDADVLGWAVPCPSVLPGVANPDWCETTCVYIGGEPPIPMFYLSVDDFPGPAPDGPDTVRHLVVVAFPRGADRVLDPPCAQAEPLPSLTTTIGKLETFRCGEGTQADGALILHGEGINRNHEMVRWYRGGVAYAVTVHQSGLDTREILRRVAEGIEYVS